MEAGKISTEAEAWLEDSMVVVLIAQGAAGSAEALTSHKKEGKHASTHPSNMAWPWETWGQATTPVLPSTIISYTPTGTVAGLSP